MGYLFGRTGGIYLAEIGLINVHVRQPSLDHTAHIALGGEESESGYTTMNTRGTRSRHFCAETITTHDANNSTAMVAKVLGCPSCRFASGGCNRCRNPDYKPRKRKRAAVQEVLRPSNASEKLTDSRKADSVCQGEKHEKRSRCTAETDIQNHGLLKKRRSTKRRRQTQLEGDHVGVVEGPVTERRHSRRIAAAKASVDVESPRAVTEGGGGINEATSPGSGSPACQKRSRHFTNVGKESQSLPALTWTLARRANQPVSPGRVEAAPIAAENQHAEVSECAVNAAALLPSVGNACPPALFSSPSIPSLGSVVSSGNAGRVIERHMQTLELRTSRKAARAGNRSEPVGVSTCMGDEETGANKGKDVRAPFGVRESPVPREGSAGGLAAPAVEGADDDVAKDSTGSPKQDSSTGEAKLASIGDIRTAAVRPRDIGDTPAAEGEATDALSRHKRDGIQSEVDTEEPLETALQAGAGADQGIPVAGLGVGKMQGAPPTVLAPGGGKGIRQPGSETGKAIPTGLQHGETEGGQAGVHAEKALPTRSRHREAQGPPQAGAQPGEALPTGLQQGQIQACPDTGVQPGKAPAGEHFLSRLHERMARRAEEKRGGLQSPLAQTLPDANLSKARRRRGVSATAAGRAHEGAQHVGEMADPRVALWEPPQSPYGLLEEQLYQDPWRLLVACLLLNKTSATQVRKVIWELFKVVPDAQAGCTADVAALEVLLYPLGLFRKRALMIQRFSQEYLTKQWTDPKELHGVGQYGSDAYRIFCRGEWRDVNPADKDLAKYHAWLVATNGEGTGLERDHVTADCLPT